MFSSDVVNPLTAEQHQKHSFSFFRFETTILKHHIGHAQKLFLVQFMIFLLSQNIAVHEQNNLSILRLYFLLKVAMKLIVPQHTASEQSKLVDARKTVKWHFEGIG